MIALPAAPALSMRQLRLLARDALKAAGIENAEREAGWLLAHALRLSYTEFFTSPDRMLISAHAAQAWTSIERRAAREPLQYILGTQDFRGLDIVVTPDVLIPRPETELVVEEAARVIGTGGRPVVADVGTGSGCIAVALAKASPHATICATDISWAALVIARRNALQHDVGGRVKFLQADLLEPLAASVEGIFDTIVSNPPYIPDGEMEAMQPEVAQFEPRLALAAGADGLTYYRRLLKAAPVLLKRGGHLVVELGFGQSDTVTALAEKARLQVLRCRKDDAGIERVLVLRRPD